MPAFWTSAHAPSAKHHTLQRRPMLVWKWVENVNVINWRPPPRFGLTAGQAPRQHPKADTFARELAPFFKSIVRARRKGRSAVNQAVSIARDL